MIADGPTTQEDLLEQRKVPCICPRQFDASSPIAVTTGISQSRGIVCETVRCSAPNCTRTWKRVNA